MRELLDAYTFNPEASNVNVDLADWYYDNGDVAAAVTFYLRVCEREETDKELIYSCLLRVYECYKSTYDRAETCAVVLDHAISMLPDRPEAYYLQSRHYESLKDWVTMYMFTTLGFRTESPAKPLRHFFGYIPDISMKFQRMIASYGTYRLDEGRQILQDFKDNDFERLPAEYKVLVYNNIRNFMACGESMIMDYSWPDYDLYRFKFPGLENVHNNFSQLYQDLFVLSCLNGKKKGIFLEIGASDPHINSNTALLEYNFDWSGWSIEINESHECRFNDLRPKSKFIGKDAREVDYSFLPDTVDFLQLDADPAQVTYEVLEKIPFETTKFAVICYEHDHYRDMYHNCRQRSREYLQDLGYFLLVPDVSIEGINSIEDWWVHPDLVSAEVIERMVSRPQKYTTIMEHMLGQLKFKYRRRDWINADL